MRSTLHILASALPLLAACASTSSGPPDTVAIEIMAALDDGRRGDAADLFAPVAESEEYRNKIYPVLFETAQERYVEGDAAGAAAVLRFMAVEYEQATAVREALLYSLFLQRSQQEQPDPELAAELLEAVEAVRDTPGAPVWVDLVETQALIDQGRVTDARQSFERFAATWEGQPESIAVFVEDVDRYLMSH